MAGELPVLVYVSAPWSRDCAAFEAGTLSDSEVRRRLQAFARFRAGPEDPALARYGSPPPPAFVLLAPGGGWIETYRGSRPPALFLELLDEAGALAAEARAELETAEREAAGGDPWKRSRLAEVLLRQRLWERVLPVLEAMEAEAPDPRALRDLGLTLVRLGRWDEGMRRLQDEEPAVLLEAAREGPPEQAAALLTRMLAGGIADPRLRAEARLQLEARQGPGETVLREGRELVRTFGCAECHDLEPATAVGFRGSCTACHQAIHRMGNDREALREYLREDPEAYQHVERIRHYLYAPDLALAGARLRPEWIRAFLRSSHDVRPLLEDSMPRFPMSGAQADLLARYLGHLAKGMQLPPFPEPSADAASVARGRRLYEEHGCRHCHAFGGETPTDPAVPAARNAPDLALARERLTPAAAAAWIRTPGRFDPAHAMPASDLGDAQLGDLLAFLFRAEVPPRPRAAPRPVPKVDREVRYEEVEEIFYDACIHCHLPEEQGGIGNSGGGWGFRPRGLDLSSYERLRRGSIGDDGVRRSVLEPGPGGAPPVLLERLLRRAREEAAPAAASGAPGMPLGLPALEPEQIALIGAWLKQGAKGPGPSHRPRKASHMGAP